MRSLLTLCAALALLGTLHAADVKPGRVNQAIELLEAGQPVYYDYGRGGYEGGKTAAKTWADMLMYDMEGAALDFSKLRDFMRGLADAGPTASGHRTPPVVVTLPLYGLDAATVQANHWMIQQTLAAGVHGLHICHAQNPEAVAAFIRAARYEIHRQGVGSGLQQGLRMFGRATGRGPRAAGHAVVDRPAQQCEPRTANPARLRRGRLVVPAVVVSRHGAAVLFPGQPALDFPSASFLSLSASTALRIGPVALVTAPSSILRRAP